MEEPFSTASGGLLELLELLEQLADRDSLREPAAGARDPLACVRRPRPGGGARAAGGGTGPATVELPEAEVETRTAEDRLWNVIVWDDPINLMSYVTYVFQKLFGYSMEVATRLMMEVHQKGRSIVATVEREKAEYYVGRLHHYGLQATLEKQTG